eukprot:scaffold6591_cov106-Cylindrotheca_fusiformis.AAC.3
MPSFLKRIRTSYQNRRRRSKEKHPPVGEIHPGAVSSPVSVLHDFQDSRAASPTNKSEDENRFPELVLTSKHRHGQGKQDTPFDKTPPQRVKEESRIYEDAQQVYLSTSNSLYPTLNFVREEKVENEDATNNPDLACLPLQQINQFDVTTRSIVPTTIEQMNDNNESEHQEDAKLADSSRLRTVSCISNNEDEEGADRGDPPATTSTPDPQHAATLNRRNETSNNQLANLQYASPKQVPPKCESMIGARVKVKSSIQDAQKRNQIGTVTRWKDRITIEMRCDNGGVFGVRLASIDFLVNAVDKRESILTPGEEPGSHIQQNTMMEASRNDKDVKHKGDEKSEEYRQQQSIPPNEMVYTSISATMNNERLSTSPKGAYKEEQSTSMNDTQSPSQKENTPSQSNELQRESVSEEEFKDKSYFAYPSLVPSFCPTILGKRVKYKDSYSNRKKRNVTGFIRGWKNRSTVEMEYDSGEIYGVRLTSLEFLTGAPRTSGTSRARTTQVSTRRTSQVTQSIPTREMRTKDCISSSTESGRVTRRSVIRSEPAIDPADSSLLSTEVEKWQVPGGKSTDQFRFGGFVIEKLRIRSDSKKQDNTFLNHLLQNRMLTVDVPFNGRRNQRSFERTIVDESGCKHDLVSCKIYNDESGPAAQKSKLARLVYARTDGHGMEAFSIQDHLLRIGDFTTLNPRKIAARLELFQSPSGLNIVFLDPADCQNIPDRGYVGGGFIREDKLKEVLEQAGLGFTQASRVSAIQVRLFIPSMGIYKGMLMKKRVSKEETAPIELPWSMQKVLKSAHQNPLPGAALVICKTGVHPSSGSANEYIGRKLLQTKTPEKSFKAKIKKPLSDMILRLWETMGVPKQLCAEYKKESLTTDRRNHAWLVGVPDPTNGLPPDTVFVPGMKLAGNPDLFVTRSPCYAYDHGRKFATIASKPDCMTTEDWDWLHNELKFGVIIFSNPRKGMLSIPERIANGDLDGDLYLVCWDKEILDSMTAAPLQDKISDDDGKLTTMPYNPDWYSDAQDIMVDAGLNNEIGFLTGKLYKLGEKYADNSESGLKDPDANAFYSAYNQALEYKKHGRPIALPNHLIEAIPPQLRHLVQGSDAKGDSAISISG